jgi:hypothetical protein
MCFSVRNGVFRGSYDDLSMFLGKKKELKFKFFRLKHLYLDFSIIKATFSDWKILMTDEMLSVLFKKNIRMDNMSSISFFIYIKKLGSQI